MKKESMAVRLQRCAREEVERALGCLRPEGGAHANVHDCRKTFKRLRALLRLLREPLGERRYSKQNQFIRDLGRRLSDWRDREVMVETVDYLAKKNADDLHLKRPLQRLRELFVSERDTALESDELRLVAADTADDLEKMSKWIGKWAFSKDENFSLIEAGLLRTYRRAKRGLSTAKKNPTNENLHEWRKRVKYLWTQCCLIDDLVPKPLRSRAKELKHLSDLLGHDHDLVVLLEQADSHFGDSANHVALKWVSGVRRSELQKHAFKLGETLFAENPKAWVKPLKKALS